MVDVKVNSIRKRLAAALDRSVGAGSGKRMLNCSMEGSAHIKNLNLSRRTMIGVGVFCCAYLSFFNL